MREEYRTLEIRRVSRVQSLQFTPSNDWTAATQLSIHFMCDAFSSYIDVALWQEQYGAIVLQGNLAKVSQNKEMYIALKNTAVRRFAEASPHDKVWGIDMNACDPRIISPTSWCGFNLLGQA